MHKKLHKILITGGAGFIGSQFARDCVREGYTVVIVDKITYAGDLERIKNIKNDITIYKTDICNKDKIDKIFKSEKPSVIVHFAAETHVDRSIMSADPFLKTNINGTQNLIDCARKYKIKKFLHISTDEVYGDHQKGRFIEDKSNIRPNNPYAATKASAEHLIRAAQKTYNFPSIIIRPANNYGPWQFPEKFIPVIIHKALSNQSIPVYGKGQQIREWLHVFDTSTAIQEILTKGKVKEIYNIGSNYDRANIKTVETILGILNKPLNLIKFVKDRPGHDFRYSVNFKKISDLGWEPKWKYTQGIHQTVDWYMNNIQWLQKKNSFLQKYWKKVYK